MVSKSSDCSVYRFVQMLTHIFKALPLYFFYFTLLIAHKIQNASNLLQNEALQYHKQISKANTFTIISIPIRFVSVT